MMRYRQFAGEDHYLVRQSDWKAIAGPMSNGVVVNIIINLPRHEAIKLSNCSRFWLAKNKHYPMGKVGEAALAADVELNKEESLRLINLAGERLGNMLDMYKEQLAEFE